MSLAKDYIVSEPLVGLLIEELRDLVSAIEWLVECDPAGPAYAAELRRVKIRLESAKGLIGKCDEETNEGKDGSP